MGKVVESKNEFCKMNANNQITVPKNVREHFGVHELTDDETVMFEVKFVRRIKPSDEK